MCLLVIMCALALLGTGTEAVVISGDRTAVGSVDKRNPGDECFSKCILRCQLMVETTHTLCCNCISDCETSCRTLGVITNRVLEENNALSQSWTPCATPCDLPDVLERRQLPRRTKRRPSRSPGLREAAIIARSVGMDMGPLETGSEQGDVGHSGERVSQIVVRLESLVQEDDSVAAVLHWDPPVAPEAPSGTPWYLVTWEPKEGGVRGNLLTNTTSVSLTLWPDTLYQIQVTTTRSGTGSNRLEVDTRWLPPATLFDQGLIRHFALSRSERVAGVITAVLLFLVIVLVSGVWWRNKLNPSKTSNPRDQDCDRFTLYPPPVTLRHLVEPSGTTQQLPV